MDLKKCYEDYMEWGIKVWKEWGEIGFVYLGVLVAAFSIYMIMVNGFFQWVFLFVTTTIITLLLFFLAELLLHTMESEEQG